MIQKNKKILMASPHHWKSAIQIGDHMLARQFAKAGWDVCFISDPITPLHLLKGFELGPRFRNYVSGGTWGENGRIWGYVPGALFMPYNVFPLRSSWVYSSWQKTTFPNVIRKIREKGFGHVDVLYTRTPRQAYLMDEIGHDVSLFRIPDHDSGFFDYNEEVGRRERNLVERVDLTVYTSKSLEPYVMNMSPRKMLYLPNGVDYEFFSNPTSRPAEYETLKGPIAVHVGSTLPERFDFDLVDMLSEHFPDVQFVFVGPEGELRRRIHRRPNVHLLGSRPLDLVPGYMQHADVGLILLDPVKNPPLVNSTNPIKLYQYLASGLPVVSRKWDTLVDLAPPMVMAENREEFCQALRLVLSDGFSNKDDLRCYARQVDWKNQFELLLDEIESVSRKRTEA